jgi:hypothetical protein
MATQGETPFFIGKQAPTLEEKVDTLTGLVRLLLLRAGTNMPVTQVGAALEGAVIGTTSQYRVVYENRYRRLIAVQIRADFSLAGQTAKLSLTQDLSDYSLIDTLAQGGKTVSDTVWLKPEQSLYLNTANTGVSLSGARFRAALFDPLSFAGYLESGI